MLKTILGRMVGTGRIPESVRAQLEHEGIEFLEDGLWGSLTLRNYRAPWRISSWSRKSALGAIGLSKQRLVVYANAECWIDLPVDHPALRALTVTAADRQLTIAFEAAALFSDRSGSVTLRYTSPRARQIAQRLQQITATQRAPEL